MLRRRRASGGVFAGADTGGKIIALLANTAPAIYAILLVGFVRKLRKLCLITSVLIIPVIIFLNPITNNLAGTFASLLISGGAAVLLYRRKERN